MTERDFAYWLQGYAEICGDRPTDEQWAMIKEHLQLVFSKVTGTRRPREVWEQATYCTKVGETTHPAIVGLLPDHVVVNRDDQGISGVVRQVHKDHPSAKWAVPWKPNWPTTGEQLQTFATDRTC